MSLCLGVGCASTAPVTPPVTSPVASSRTLSPRKILVEGLTFTEENGTRTKAASCPLGHPNCNPENAQGIYNVEGGDFCIETGSTASALRGTTWSHWFCPIGFVRRDEGVYLRGLWHTSEDSSQYRYAEARIGAELRGEQVTPIEVTTKESRLEVRYRGGDGEVHTLSGAQVSELIFIFRADERLHELRLGPPRSYPADAGSDGVWEYSVTWRRQGASRFGAWQALCRGPKGRGTGQVMPASFLGGVSFDPFTATRVSDEAAVTMSCQLGGITRCIEGGYRPWSPKEGPTARTADELIQAHAACVQRRGRSLQPAHLAQHSR